MAMQVTVRIEGADQVIRKLGRVGPDAEKALRDQAFDVAKQLARKMQATARGLGRQTARGASTVEALKAGLWPEVIASNTGRAQGLLFGSEFGMKRKSGWYAKPRYFNSRSRQFRPWHQGSYWFHLTAEREQPWVEREWGGRAADIVVQKWNAA